MNNVYLLLGGNQGDRFQLLMQALELVGRNCGPVRSRSSIYETAAWGISDQPSFLNMAVYIETNLAPVALLHATQKIERELGREREVQWGPRTIDIDILFYNDGVINTPELVVPHSYLHERRFTLAPLNEIATYLVHPVLNKTVAELLASCQDPLSARLYNGQ